MTQTVLLVMAVLALFIAIAALFQNWQLQGRLKSVLAGDQGQSLEKILNQYSSRVEKVDRDLLSLSEDYRRLETLAGLASQKISIVRFNPFGDTGGDQSFALAVLDAHDSGYVLTSIHGRQGTRAYVKPVDNGKSKYTLSAEEKQALQQAAKRVPTKEK